MNNRLQYCNRKWNFGRWNTFYEEFARALQSFWLFGPDMFLGTDVWIGISRVQYHVSCLVWVGLMVTQQMARVFLLFTSCLGSSLGYYY